MTGRPWLWKAVQRAFGGHEPTEEQRAAVMAPAEPVLVLAGAGTGKTAVMAARAAYLIASGAARPSQLLCLTFTNKAAVELEERIGECLRCLAEEEGPPEGEPTVLTYHAFALELVREFGLHLGLPEDPVVLSEAGRWQMALEVLDEMDFEHLDARTAPSTVRKVLAMAEALANYLLEPEVLLARGRMAGGAGESGRTELARMELARAVQMFQEKKEKAGVVDFADQVSLAYRLAELEEVRERVRSRHPHLLLDEYQDTNVAQARLLRRIWGPGSSITAVGDPNQSIYRWRGASLANILRFPQDFPRSDGSPASVYPLTTNYRSGRAILSLAARVAEGLPTRSRRGNLGLPDTSRLRPHPEKGEGDVLAFFAADQLEEARQVARLAREWAEEIPLGEMAVLVRKKRLLGPLRKALEAQGIPVDVVGIGGLLQLPEVVEVVSYLKVLGRPEENAALARLLLGPRWRLGPSDLAALARAGRRMSRRFAGNGEDGFPVVLTEVLEALEEVEGLSEQGRRRLLLFREELSKLRARVHLPPGELARAVIAETGLLREAEVRGGARARSIQRNLNSFLEWAESFAPPGGDGDLVAFLAYLDAVEEAGEELDEPVPEKGDAVQLLTVHQAKGLEWEVVFIPGLAEAEGGRPSSSLFPDLKAEPDPSQRPEVLPWELRTDLELPPEVRRGDRGALKARKEFRERENLEDETRLFYVACTRAKRRLVLSGAWWYLGSSLVPLREPLCPSRFYQTAARAGAKVLFEAEKPAENPLRLLLEERKEPWARAEEADPLFGAGGLAGEVERAREGRGSPPPAGQGEAYTVALEEFLARAPGVRSPRPLLPPSLSVTAILEYARCPRRFHYGHVLHVPRPSSAFLRLGAEFHAWVNGEAGQLVLEEFGPAEPGEEVPPSPGVPSLAALQEAFRSSRFHTHPPLAREVAFVLPVGEVAIRGRVDAIFEREGGLWELVDYKTGEGLDPDDPARRQLDLYLLGVKEVFGRPPSSLLARFVWVRPEGVVEEEARVGSGEVLEETREWVSGTLARLARAFAFRDFPPSPSLRCRSCHYLYTCPEGKRGAREDPLEARFGLGVPGGAGVPSAGEG